MQPCHVCGGNEVDFGGHCTRCGTYRDQQSFDLAAPGSGPSYGGPSYAAPTGPPAGGPGYGDPASAPPYASPAGGPGYGAQGYADTGYGGPPYASPASGPAYGGQASGPAYGGQASGPPYGGQASGPPYGGQASAPPYGGQAGAPPYASPAYQPAQPVAYQPAQPSRSRSFMVPLIALSAIAVVLVAGIVVVIVNRAGDGGSSVGIDKCVVGKWRVADQKEKVILEGGGTADYTASGYTVDFRADGTGLVEHNGTTFRSTVNGKAVTIVVQGKVNFEYRTTGNQYTETNLRPEGTTTTTVGNERGTTESLSVTVRPAKYTCSGDTMVQETDLSRTEFRRL